MAGTRRHKAEILPARKTRVQNDALGRRVQKETKTGGTWTVQEKYLWGGMNQGLLAVYNASSALVMRFEYAGGRLPVAMTYNGSKYYLVYDQVGSLRAVFDTSGVRKVETVYDSFGNIPAADYNTLGITLPLGFAGGLHDRQTGLVLFGHRDYDPKTGRWTAKDPIGFAGGDVNLYGYIYANPIGGYDLSGLSLESSNGITDFRSPVGRFLDWFRDIHYNRNNLNEQMPPTITPWRQMEPGLDIYHRQGGGRNWYNRKFISPTGHSEAVLDVSGEPVNDSQNRGSYNFSPPTTTLGSAGHVFLDMMPYILWGNCPDDPTILWHRIVSDVAGHAPPLSDFQGNWGAHEFFR